MERRKNQGNISMLLWDFWKYVCVDKFLIIFFYFQIVLLLQISECLDVNPNILDIPIKSEIRPLTRGKNDIFFLQPVSYQVYSTFYFQAVWRLAQTS